MLRLLPPSIAIVAVAMIGVGALGTALASEVQGQVLMGPMCPGPAQIDVECPSTPITTTVDVFTVRSDGSMPATPVTSVATDSSGNFRLSLTPGHYWFVPRPPKPAGIASSKPMEVTVVPAGITMVTLSVDTGMR